MPATFLLDDRLPAAELMAAGLDGDVRRCGPAHTSVDVSATRELRAEALSALIPPDAVVEGRAAAWVHGVLASPRVVVVGRRASVRPPPGLSCVRVRQVRYADDDVQRVVGLAVTTPLRTALDVARQVDRFDLLTATAVATLLAQDGVDPVHATDALVGREGLPHLNTIRGRLAEIERLVSLR